MSLTVVSHPNNIDNSGAFNVTTTLSEDSTHVNLRVRAEITVSAVIVATVEKPKNLSDFDFSDILASNVTGIILARNTGAYYNTSGGSPLVAYTILFTEVWEDGTTGVTTTGATNNASGTTFKYVPAKGDGTAFTNYVLTGVTSKFANLTLKNNVCKFYSVNPSEYWLVFFTEHTALSFWWNKDDESSGFVDFTASNGWGMIIINANQLMSGVVSYLQIQIYDNTHAVPYSAILTINLDTSSIDERVVLEYDGLVGGKEYLAFEGLKDQEFKTIRNYYAGSKKNRKPISFVGVCSQKLETLYRDQANTEYLKSLLISTNVKRLEVAYATPTDVTVVTDTVTINKGRELITNQIEIEYEY
jgi:hypothetical protein